MFGVLNYPSSDYRSDYSSYEGFDGSVGSLNRWISGSYTQDDYIITK